MDADQTVSTHTYVDPPGSGTTPFALGSTVGRFVIRDRLGTGGMGEVYRAEDTQLKRTVAIKRLVASDRNPSHATRLLKEAQRASALNHTHIAGVYDVVTVGSELLLVMEYVDGVTLRERMKEDISVADFCTIAVQCTEALSAAHRKGILHGDLKPANIMLTGDGQVKVCDFGLARRLPKSEGAAETTTTTQHGIAGTPAYLPPEAILEQQVDERADIFSLGVVFYQMLARRHPFVADGLMATLDRVLHEAPEPLDRVNPAVSGKLARAVQRMIEKEPRDRYASVTEVGATLSAIAAQQARIERRRKTVRRMRAGAALAAAALVAVFAIPRVSELVGRWRLAPLPQSLNVVVLPFSVVNADADRQLFAEGLTASLSGQLSRLTLTPRGTRDSGDLQPIQVVTEADRRWRQVTTPREASDQFGANVALRGSLRFSGTGVEVATDLVDTKSGRTLRTTPPFTIADADPIAVETRIVEAVTRWLNIDLNQQERTRISAGTVKPRAHHYYLQGLRYLSDDDRLDNVELAIELFRTAQETDERYALAYAGLGQAYWRKHELTKESDWVGLARGNCQLALDRDASRAESHICMAMVLNGTGEYRQAVDRYRDALERDPTNDVAYAGLAAAYGELKQHRDAEQTYIHAIELRPHYWRGYYALGSYYWDFGRYKGALDQFEEVVRLAPDSFRGHNNVGAALFSLNRIPEAIAAFKKSMLIRPNNTAASNLGTLYYFEGQHELAADYFQQAISFDPGRYEIWGNLAHTFELLGRKRESREAYQEARKLVRERLRVNPNNALLHVDLAAHQFALGDTAASAQELAAAVRLGPDDALTLFRIAVFYEHLMHMRDEALAWLRKAIERGQAWHEIERAPELNSLRADPKFAKLRTLKTSQ